MLIDVIRQNHGRFNLSLAEEEETGYTLLMFVVQCRTDAAQLVPHLLAAGANVNACTRQRKTALAYAILLNAADPVVDTLLEHGANWGQAYEYVRSLPMYMIHGQDAIARFAHMEKCETSCRATTLCLLGPNFRLQFRLSKDVARLLAQCVWRTRLNKKWG
jgi:ankyrin repeat protein